LTREARDGVGGLASRKGDDDAHRPRRIGLRPSEARGDRQRGSTRGQMQKSSAETFHDASSQKHEGQALLRSQLMDSKLRMLANRWH
jgi:hypothetical protein